MSSTRHLRCIVQDYSTDTIFTITANTKLSVSELREVVHKELRNRDYHRFDYRNKNLYLFKVDISLPSYGSGPIEGLNISEGATKLDRDWYYVSDIWPVEPPRHTLNIVVKIPFVFCQVIDHEKRLLGKFLTVSIGESEYLDILYLKRKVQETKKLNNIEADDLVVWRCDMLVNPNLENLAEIIDAIDFSDPDQATELDNRMPVARASLGLSDNEMLLVQMRDVHSTRPSNRRETDPDLDLDEDDDYNDYGND